MNRKLAPPFSAPPYFSPHRHMLKISLKKYAQIPVYYSRRIVDYSGAVILRFSIVRTRFSSNVEPPYRSAPCRSWRRSIVSFATVDIAVIGPFAWVPISPSALVVLLCLALSHNCRRHQMAQPMYQQTIGYGRMKGVEWLAALSTGRNETFKMWLFVFTQDASGEALALRLFFRLGLTAEIIKGTYANSDTKGFHTCHRPRRIVFRRRWRQVSSLHQPRCDRLEASKIKKHFLTRKLVSALPTLHKNRSIVFHGGLRRFM